MEIITNEMIMNPRRYPRISKRVTMMKVTVAIRTLRTVLVKKLRITKREMATAPNSVINIVKSLREWLDNRFRLLV